MPQKKKKNNAFIWFGLLGAGALTYFLTRPKTDNGSGSGSGGGSGGGNLPRGLANKNPLNIKISKINWLNKVPENDNTDGTFEQFLNMQSGYLATIQNLDYYIRHGIDTTRKIIYMWDKGGSGTYPQHYLDYVLANSELDENQKWFPAVMVDANSNFNEGLLSAWDLVRAMGELENGVAFKSNILQTWKAFKEAYIQHYNDVN